MTGDAQLLGETHRLIIAPLGALCGAGLAIVYFRALALNTRLWLGDGGIARPLALHMGRTAVAIAAFVLAAHFGAGVLLASFAGFIVTRTVIVRRIVRDRRTP